MAIPRKASTTLTGTNVRLRLFYSLSVIIACSVIACLHATGEDPNFIPDPKPLLDFDLKTAKTRDYLYVNKALRCVQ
jgi:hypothetical protein